jgi:quinol-cytochrome oxidoreductase complex cytochrome b subunit
VSRVIVAWLLTMAFGLATGFYIAGSEANWFSVLVLTILFILASQLGYTIGVRFL